MNVLFIAKQDPIADILQETWDRQSLPARRIELRCVEGTDGYAHYAYYAVGDVGGVQVSRWLGTTCEQSIDAIADLAHQQTRRP